MSECNFCTLQRIQRRADAMHATVVLMPSHRLYEVVEEFGPLAWSLGEGTDCFVVPYGQTLNTSKHLVSWFMALPDHCAC